MAPTNETESLICLDIQENFSDAFIILHEGIHRMYLETNPPNYTLDELPSAIMEWLFYQYCLEKEELKEETKLFFQKNLQIISTISKDYLINHLLKNLYISNMEITENNIWNFKNKKLKNKTNIKKRVRRIFVVFYTTECFDTFRRHSKCKLFTSILLWLFLSITKRYECTNFYYKRGIL